MSENTRPVTIEEALRQIHAAVQPDDRAAFRAMTKDEFTVREHHGLGRWLRNVFGLWEDDNPLLKACEAFMDPPEYLDEGKPHPDAISGVLMGMYWEYLQERD